MAQIVLTQQAFDDLERLSDFLQQQNPVAADGTIRLIIEAVQILTNHPLIGRPVERGFRELVISRGRSGYLALYDFDDVIDSVFVLSIRHQREAGFID